MILKIAFICEMIFLQENHYQIQQFVLFFLSGIHKHNSYKRKMEFLK